MNRQYRLGLAAEREAYLDKLSAALAHTDWQLLGYALMNNHVHLVLRAGDAPPWRLLKPLHISMARWLNARHRTFGPVFAERATTVVLPPQRTAYVMAYVHNNPVRAALVADPAESNWTSHQAYIGRAQPLPCLEIERGLQLCGFDASAQGRLAFHRFVCSRSASGHDPSLSGADLPGVRARVRRSYGLPVELGSPRHETEGVACALYLRSMVPKRTRWAGDVGTLLAAVEQKSGVSLVEMRSGVKVRPVVEARRLALVVGTRLLGRELHEIAAALCLSNSAASELAKQGHRVADAAREVAQQLLEQPEPGATSLSPPLQG